MRLERSFDILMEIYEGAPNVERLINLHLEVKRLRIEPRNVINYLRLC